MYEREWKRERIRENEIERVYRERVRMRKGENRERERKRE